MNLRLAIDRIDIPGFTGVKFAGFGQAVQDWTDPKTGEFYPATFDWYGNLYGSRIRDGVNFYHRVRVAGKKDEPIDVLLAEAHLSMAVKLFEADWGNPSCTCKPGIQCEFHKGRQ